MCSPLNSAASASSNPPSREAALNQRSPHAVAPDPSRAQEPWISLTHQSLGRALSADEIALASALEAIYTSGVGDFAEVVRRLTDQGVVAPASRLTTWTADLLEQELAAINQSLDGAYAQSGIGA